MARYVLLASTIISGAVALSLPGSAAVTGVAITKSNPAVVDTAVATTSGYSALLVQVADDDDQGDDNDGQGGDNDGQ